MKNSNKVIVGTVAVIFAAGIGFNSYAGIKTMKQLSSVRDENKQTSETLDKFSKILDSEINGDVAQEDDVRISMIYEIKSTTHISDAYKSGNTDELDDRDKETLEMASKVLDEIIKDGMSDYEKELAVYKWMTKKLGYDRGALVVIPTSDANSDNPYGVLKNRNAVCVGYATTFRLFMQMLDIECMVIHNSERYHSWNLVKLDDEWYHTDIYSDADSGNYANFNVNDAVRCQAESWNTDFFPAAKGIKYNYGYQNRKEIENVYDMPKLIKELNDSKEGSASFIELKGGYDEKNFAIATGILDSIAGRIAGDEEYDFPEFDYTWIPKDESSKDFYLNVTITKINHDSDNAYELSEDDYEKISEAVEKYFPYSDYFDDYDEDDVTIINEDEVDDDNDDDSDEIVSEDDEDEDEDEDE